MPNEHGDTPQTPENGDAEYGADSIKVLKGLEAVRKRPGMYIGGHGPRAYLRLLSCIADEAYEMFRDSVIDPQRMPHCFLTAEVRSERMKFVLTWNDISESISRQGPSIDPTILFSGGGNDCNGLAIANAVSSSFRLTAAFGQSALSWDCAHGKLLDRRAESRVHSDGRYIVVELTPDCEVFSDTELSQQLVEGYIWALCDRYRGMVLESEKWHKNGR